MNSELNVQVAKALGLELYVVNERSNKRNWLMTIYGEKKLLPWFLQDEDISKDELMIIKSYLCHIKLDFLDPTTFFKYVVPEIQERGFYFASSYFVEDGGACYVFTLNPYSKGGTWHQGTGETITEAGCKAFIQMMEMKK